jgi:hypothetical protein
MKKWKESATLQCATNVVIFILRDCKGDMMNINKQLAELNKEIKLTRRDIKKIRRMLEYRASEDECTYIG